MHTFFNNQLFTLTNGRSSSDQRSYDIRVGEFAAALTVVRRERRMNRRARLPRISECALDDTEQPPVISAPSPSS